MKKDSKLNSRLLIAIIAIMLLTVTLSGCTDDIKTKIYKDDWEYTLETEKIGEINVTGCISKIEILEYNAFTERKGYRGDWAKEADGFGVIREDQYGYEVNNQRHVISGKAKNIAGEMLKLVVIKATFLNAYGGITLNLSFEKNNVEAGEVFDFEIIDSKVMGDGSDPVYSSSKYFELTIWTDYATLVYGEEPPTIISDKRIIGKWEYTYMISSGSKGTEYKTKTVEYTKNNLCYENDSSFSYTRHYWLKDGILYLIDHQGRLEKCTVELEGKNTLNLDWTGRMNREDKEWGRASGYLSLSRAT